MISLCLALSSFRCSSPPDRTGRYLVTDVPSAVHLSATRRAREGKYVGALGICARNFGAQLRRKSGQNHLLPHIQTPYLTSTSISSTFCRSRLGDGRGREPAPGGAKDATDLAGGEREEAEKEGGR